MRHLRKAKNGRITYIIPFSQFKEVKEYRQNNSLRLKRSGTIYPEKDKNGVIA